MTTPRRLYRPRRALREILIPDPNGDPDRGPQYAPRLVALAKDLSQGQLGAKELQLSLDRGLDPDSRRREFIRLEDGRIALLQEPQRE